MSARAFLYDDSLWILPPVVKQRMIKGGHLGVTAFSEAPGICNHTSTCYDSGHPHSVPLTDTQTALVLDEEFVRAWFGPEVADRLFRETVLEAE